MIPGNGREPEPTPESGRVRAELSVLLLGSPVATVFRELSAWQPTIWVRSFSLRCDLASALCLLQLQMAEPSVSPSMREMIVRGRIAQTWTSLQMHFLRSSLSARVVVAREGEHPIETIKSVLDAL